MYCPTSTAVIVNGKRTVLLLAATSEEGNVKAGNDYQKSQHSFQSKLDKMEYFNESSKKVRVKKELEKTIYDIFFFSKLMGFKEQKGSNKKKIYGLGKKLIWLLPTSVI